MESFDEREVYRWFDVFKEGNQLTEVRIIDNEGRNGSGYFTDAKTLINAVKPYCNDYSVYFTINRVNPDCYGRPQHDRIVIRPKNTTTDAEIIGRDYILIDLDSKRASGVSATDEQLGFAQKKANDVYKFLKDNGFYEPIVVRSGSGVHIYIRCALKASKENDELVKRFLSAMGMIFSDDNVDVDLKVYNPARISRVVGFYNRKGAKNDPKRPQRLCSFVRIPKEIKVNDREYFEKIASLYPEEVKPSRENNYSVSKFNLEEFIQRHNIQVTKIEEVAGGKKYILDHCLFNEQHRGKDAVIFQRDNGAISYFCFHSSCQGNDWHKVRLMYEPDAYDKKEYKEYKYDHSRFKKEFVPIKETKEKGEVWLKMSQVKKPKFSLDDYIPSGIKQIDDLIIGFKRKHVTVWSGYRGCVDCDTEFFNGNEWKKISDYKNGERVLQYNLDGSAELVIPKMYHKIKADNLTWLSNPKGSINQCLCEYHNLVYKTSKGNIYKKNFGIIKKSFKSNGKMNGFIIPHFSYSGIGIDWSDDEIKLELAISAEAYMNPNRPNKKGYVRINLKHQYKKDTLIELLNKLNITYKTKYYNKEDRDMVTYTFCWEKASKTFSIDWYNMNRHQFSVVKDNITTWDGYVQKGRGGSYSTTIKENADFVQFCVSSLERRCSISRDYSNGRKKTWYRLHFSKDKNYLSLGNKSIKMVDYKTKDGYKYCFSVSSGMLVLRRGGAINITGNCAKTTFLNMLVLNGANLGYKSALWTGELDVDEEKQWLYLQAAGKGYNKEVRPDFYATPDNVCDKIDPWIDKYFWIFNNEYKNNFKQIVDKIRDLKEKEDIDFVILDNLMVLDIDDLEGDKNDRQKNLMYTLTCLAKELNIHVHIVAHPNKSGTFLRPNNISGTGHIPDLAQNVFILHRVGRDFHANAQEFLSSVTLKEIEDSGCTNCMEICKCRAKGSAVDHFIHLYFERESNRLKNSVAEHINYGWQEEPVQAELIESKPNYQMSVEEYLSQPMSEEVPF